MIKPKDQSRCNIVFFFSIAIEDQSIILTLNDSQQNDDHEEEERDVEHYTINLVIVTVRFTNFIAYTTAGSYAFVQMENETLKVNKEVYQQFQIKITQSL